MLCPMQSLQDLTKTHIQSNHSPSGIVAVGKHGQLLEKHSWGTDGNNGYDETTPFRIASLTKSFTGLALLILRRQGKVGLDDEVVRHLPELRVLTPSSWAKDTLAGTAEHGQASGGNGNAAVATADDWPTLRIRHLLAMTSGLATDNPWGDRQESITRETLMAWASNGLRLMFAPGTNFEYSNLGYALLGEVISRAAETDYRQFVLEQILEPLQLNDTRYSAEDLPAAAKGYHREPMLVGQPSGWTLQQPSAAGAFSSIGGLYSSVRDLLTWTNLFMTKNVPEGAAFTAADLVEAQEPLGPVLPYTAQPPLHGAAAGGYGSGLAIERNANHGKIVSHGGGYPAFTSFMTWHVPSGTTVIASTNGTHSMAGMLARQVLLSRIVHLPKSEPTQPAWPETVKAAEQLTQMVRRAQNEDAAALALEYADVFAENVEMDFPVVRRLEYLQSALVNLGALKDERSEPRDDQPCRATWTIPAEYGLLELDIELAPVAPFGVQTFGATVTNGRKKVELF